MNFYLNDSAIEFELNNGPIEFKLNAPSPGGVPPVTCEVTYTDDTCVDYNDGTFASYQ